MYIALCQLLAFEQILYVVSENEILMRERNARTGRVRLHTGAGEDMVMSCTCQASMNNCALYCNYNVLILHLCCILLLCLQIVFSYLLQGLVTLWWRFQRYI